MSSTPIKLNRHLAAQRYRDSLAPGPSRDLVSFGYTRLLLAAGVLSDDNWQSDVSDPPSEVDALFVVQLLHDVFQDPVKIEMIAKKGLPKWFDDE